MSKENSADDKKKLSADRSGATSRDYAVGYGRPPVAHQFKKGVSANPKGRPKKRERSWSENQLCADILQEADKQVIVSVNGKRESISMHVLIVRRILADAARGNRHAQRLACEITNAAAQGRARLLPKLYSQLRACEQTTFSEAPYPPDETFLGFMDYVRKKTRQT